MNQPSHSPSEKVQIATGPRLHIGLLDVGFTTPRVYGGGGFSIDQPKTVVSVMPEASVRVDVRARGLSAVHTDEIARAASTALMRASAAFAVSAPALTVDAVPPPHVGLGSRTSLLCSIVAAVAHLARRDVPSAKEMAGLTLRGGVSSIGVYSFLHGGFLTDLGHKRPAVASFGPSSSIDDGRLAPMGIRLNIPPSWKFLLLLPPGETISGDSEQEFFRRATPVPSKENRKALAAIYHGVAAAVAEDDLPALAKALDRVNSVAFKKREIAMRGTAFLATVSLIADALRGIAALGMSSLGPLLFAIYSAEDDQEIRSRLDLVCSSTSTKVLTTAGARNAGRVARGKGGSFGDICEIMGC